MGGSMPCPRPLQATTILQSLSSSAPNLQRSALSLEIGRPRFDSSVSLSEPHPMAFQATLFGIVTEFRASSAKQSGSSCSLEGVNLKRCLPASLAYKYEGFHQGKAALSTFRSKKYNERLGSRCIHPRSTSDIPEFKQQLCSSSLFVIAGRRGTELATNLSRHTCSARKRTSHTVFRKAGEVKAVISGLQESVLEEGAEQADAEVSIVENLLDFLNESWTPFHATAEAKRLLLEAGFKQLFEQDEWVVEPGGRYFFTRNMSAIIAFAIGQNYQAGKGFHVIAAHTDSPCPKLKPVSAALKSGFLNIGVQTYGGGLWHTWFDRDLTVAGRVLIKSRDGLLAHKLVKVRRPILRIPTLAIHLDRSVNTDGFKPNLETHLAPVLATQIKAGLNPAEGNGAVHSVSKAHHPLLLQVLADELNCEVDEIEDFELNVCDTQPSCIGGAKKEFIFSGRLDNLASSFCALRALLDSCRDSTDLASESCIRMVALFDNEEVGSDSAQGAGSPTMFQAMKRIARWLNRSTESEGIVERTIRRSFLVSADMAHALHPNYPERHEDHHQPKLHEGLVIKHNANQRYATNSVTAFLFREVAKSREIPTQNFVVRNDMGCGSTIGPILASGIGIRTVDCGMPQLSMHSVREMCGTEDVDIAYRHFKAFYHLFTSIDEQLSIDS